MDICCFSDGFLSFFTYTILINVSNGAKFCMKLPYFIKEISIFAPKPCILRNLRSKRERSGFSLLNLTVLILKLISFSMLFQALFLFLGLINIFMGSLFSIPLHRLELISFSATPGNKCCHGHGNTFLCFLGLKIFLRYLCIPNPCTDFK